LGADVSEHRIGSIFNSQAVQEYSLILEDGTDNYKPMNITQQQRTRGKLFDEI